MNKYFWHIMMTLLLLANLLFSCHLITEANYARYEADKFAEALNTLYDLKREE